jgi:uncharacterized protein YfaS (alpha-2-macroglobulin family)
MSDDNAPETPKAEDGAKRRLAFDWRAAATRLRQPVVLISAAALIIGFGGGVLTAKTIEAARGAGSPAAATATKGGVDWPFFGKPRGANAPRQGVPKPEGFAVWRSRIDTSGREPLACIEMSRPLDPSKPYADYVLVSPETGSAPAVTARGSELCLGGLGFTDRRVTLLKGLPGRGKDALAANADVDFTFGDRPPFVGFAGDGVILPREEADGVGIETVNVTRLAIEVWRVSDRNLVRKSITASEPSGEDDWMGPWGDDYPGEDGRKIWSGEVAVRANGAERAVTVFPLGAVLKTMSPGGYVIVARDASGGRAKAEDEEDGYQNRTAMSRRWVIFTDMALMSYSGSEGVDAVVRSLKSAKTIAGVPVSLVAANGETLAEAKTDASGRVRFARPLLEGKLGMRPKMLMAYGGQGDLAVLDLERSPVDLSRQGIGGRNDEASVTAGRDSRTNIDGYLYADRGIYRPGETVHLVGLVRDRTAVAADRKGSLVISRPSGVEYQRFAFDKTADGAVARDILLPKTAPRGRWTARIEIEGLDDPAGQMSFSVEDFAPQRLAVDVEGQAATPIRAGEDRAVLVTSRFLYGAPGAGLQVQGEARIAADPTPFPKFRDYQFGDEQTPFQEQVQDPTTTVTDGAGRANLNIPATLAGDTHVPLKALVTASVFEPGGRPVRESVTLRLRPRPLYLGVKIDQGDAGRRDTPVSFDIVALDAAGNRVAAQGVAWTLVTENWDYDWYQQNGRWQYRRTSRDVVAARGTGNISAAQALRLTRRLGWGDYRLELVGPSGARTVVKFAAGWGSPAREDDSPDLVRVSAGTKQYAQGDTVEITVKAPYEGEAQIAVATDHVIDFKTVHIPAGGTTVRLKTSAEWGGGAYVMATVIQPRDPVATPKPRRAMGLVYVPLEPRGRRLTVDIGTPAKLESRAAIEVPVKVNGLGFGQRARVTIAAVDEGILRLTKFDSPDPVKWYFGKRALGVDYRDDYARLLNPNLGAPAGVSFGGDEIGGEGLTVTPIKTVALWSGVVETGLDGRAVIKLPAAEFNGELRLMAVAWTDKAVGSGSKAMTVREAVVADLNLPRFLSPGDKAVATLELHNLEGKAGNYEASVTATGGVVAAFKKLVALVVGQRTIQRIDVAAPGSTGISNVAMRVAGPGFSTAKAYPIQTRLGWGAETRTITELQRPGEAFTPSSQVMQGLAQGSVTLQVSYSPFKGFDPAAVALALGRYPYGCTEQLVSAAYPLLYATKFTDDPKLKRTSPALNAAIGQILDRQSLDGSFGLWRVGDGEADPWLGAYVTDFLIEAKGQGAPVPQDAIDRALGAMRLVSKPDGYTSVAYRMSYPDWWAGGHMASEAATKRMRSRASAYALYVMAKGKKGDLARLRWWHDVQMKSDNDPVARAQVAAGLAMMGDAARARSALRGAIQKIGYRDETDWYQSPLRDLAAVITYAHEAGELGTARQLQGRLDGAVRDPDNLNTQEQARLLQAAHAMLEAAGPIKVTATGAYALAPVAGQPRWAVGKLADAKFVNAGTGALWRTVTVRGTAVSPPGADSAGIGVSKTLWSLNGGRVDPIAIAQGDRVIVQISGRSSQGRSMMMVIDDALPAGFEVETVLGPEDAQSGPFRFLGELSGVSVQEKRDDRYVAALNLPGNQAFTVAYVARAVTPGAFYLPGVEARDMYKPGVFGRSAGGQIVIAAGP